MSYPGIVLAVMAVVAVGTVIYNLVSGQRQRPLHYHDGPDRDYDYSYTPRTVTPVKRTNGSGSSAPRKRETDELCTICGEVMTFNLQILEECGHRVHRHCLAKWRYIENSCPKCRSMSLKQ